MDVFELVLAKKAARQLDRMQRGNPNVFRQVIAGLEELQQDPYGPKTAALKGLDADRRMRVGGYRILYSVERDQLLIEVLRLGPRGDIYK